MQNQISMNALQQQMLKHYIDSVFEKYDTDRNGVLDPQEMACFFNDLYKNMNSEASIDVEQAKAAIKSIDTNNDGLVDKKELFAAFKQLMAQNQPMQNIVQYQQQVYQQQQMQQPVGHYPPQMPQQQMGYQSYPQQQPQYYPQPQPQPVYYAQQPQTNYVSSMWQPRVQGPSYQVVRLPPKNNTNNRQIYTQPNNGCSIY